MEKQDLFARQETRMLLYGKDYVVTSYFPKLNPEEYQQRKNQIVGLLHEILNSYRPCE